MFRLDKIRIYSKDRSAVIEMPVTRSLTVGGVEVSEETTMVSGKLVRDVRGIRPVLTGEWEWLPVETVSALHILLRQGGFFYVEYPDPAAGDSSGMFSISYPTTKVFRFVDGVPRWYGASLTMTAQEVIPCSQ